MFVARAHACNVCAEREIHSIRFDYNSNTMTIEGTYRPSEIEREPHGVAEGRQVDICADVNDVLAEDGRHDVAVCAWRRRVDLHLVLLQAYPEPRLAGPQAFACSRCAAGTALAQAVLAVLVHEGLQPQLEYPRGAYL